MLLSDSYHSKINLALFWEILSEKRQKPIYRASSLKKKETKNKRSWESL